METERWVEDWALKWAEGTILGFARGRIELNRALGMLRKAIEMIGDDDKIYAIIKNIEKNPIYLPRTSNKVAKLRQLREALHKEESVRSR